MKCEKHGIEKVRVNMLGEWLCPKCVRCPSCGKEDSVIDSNFGVTYGIECKKKNGSVNLHKRSTNSILEEIATPLWKIAGLKPNAHEVAEERKRKYLGLSHEGMRERRAQEARGGYNNADIKQKLFRGELKDGGQTSYNRS